MKLITLDIKNKNKKIKTIFNSIKFNRQLIRRHKHFKTIKMIIIKS
jgi:hypothetical protein